jgi:hypothetical protein
VTRLLIGELELIYCGRRGNTHIFENYLGDIRIEFAKHLEFDRRLGLRDDRVWDLLVEWFAENFGPRFLEKNW